MNRTEIERRVNTAFASVTSVSDQMDPIDAYAFLDMLTDKLMDEWVLVIGKCESGDDYEDDYEEDEEEE